MTRGRYEHLGLRRICERSDSSQSEPQLASLNGGWNPQRCPEAGGVDGSELHLCGTDLRRPVVYPKPKGRADDQQQERSENDAVGSI